MTAVDRSIEEYWILTTTKANAFEDLISGRYGAE
jgi:hypothetical protein